MMALTPDQEKLKEAALAASPGPWTAHAIPYDGLYDPYITSGEMYVCQTVYDMQSGTTDHDVDADTAYIAAANPAAILAILAQLEQVQGWVSVDAEQKPTGRKPILVAVSCIKFGEHEDGTPGEAHSRVVTEGEYIPKHGDSGDYFTAYASPMADQEWITHWRELPPPPEAA